jgi:UDP-N-acetylglucosamine--N-acetylmuramyl-(pentapeptide) pyrophosphoryl-undecaprenol N-acetylglucosamine transferase
MRKVFLVGGGTGGHLFPAISIAQELEGRGFATCLVTDVRCQRYLPTDLKIQTIVLNLASMGSGLLQKIKALFSIAISTIVMLKVFWAERPSLLVAFGGYPSLPVLIAAMVFRTPIVLHEQNCFMGKVNKLFCSRAKLIALNFAKTFNLPENSQDKTVVVGNPVREQIKLCNLIKDFAQVPFTILIVGGSQGAVVFDELVPSAIKILRTSISTPIKIVQQSAKKNHERIAQIYKELGIDYELSDFFKNMPELYGQSSLAICRSGASTIAELIYLGLPSILVPLPTSAANHQFYNAKALLEQGAAIYFIQKYLTPQILADEIKRFVLNTDALQDMRNNLLGMRVDSAKIFTDHIISLLVRNSK